MFGLLLLTVFLATAISALCSLMEASLFAVPRPHAKHLADSGSKRGKLLMKFKEDMGQPIAAILILNTVSHTIGAAVVQACHQLENSFVNAARLSSMEVLRWPGVVKEPVQDLQPLQSAREPSRPGVRSRPGCPIAGLGLVAAIPPHPARGLPVGESGPDPPANGIHVVQDRNSFYQGPDPGRRLAHGIFLRSLI